MIRKIILCAVIALILVPAGVLAAGSEGQNAGTAAGQCQCLHDGQNSADQPCTLASGNQSQFRYGAQQNRENGIPGYQNGTGTRIQKHTRSQSRIHDGTCSGCKNIPVPQP